MISPLPKDVMLGLPEELAEALNDRLSRFAEVIETTQGKRGALKVESAIKMEANKIARLKDPVEGRDGVNLTTLLRFRDCKFLLQILRECNDFQDMVADVASAGSTGLELTTTAFWGYTTSPPASTTATGTGGINEVHAYLMVVPFDIIVTKVTYEKIDGATANRKCSAGLYNLERQLVLDSGTFESNVAAGARTNTISPTLVESGTYYFGWCGGGLSYRVCFPLNLRETFPIIDGPDGLGQGTDGTTGSGGALPSSIGTLTQDTILPPAVLFET